MMQENIKKDVATTTNVMIVKSGRDLASFYHFEILVHLFKKVWKL